MQLGMTQNMSGCMGEMGRGRGVGGGGVVDFNYNNMTRIAQQYDQIKCLKLYKLNTLPPPNSNIPQLRSTLSLLLPAMLSIWIICSHWNKKNDNVHYRDIHYRYLFLKSRKKLQKHINLMIFPKLIKKRGLHMIHLNINSLLNKIHELRFIAQKSNPTIIGITESKLDDTVLNSEVSIEGYTLFRSDQMRNGGGVIMYVNNFVGVKERKNSILNSTSFDAQEVFILGDININMLDKKNKFILNKGYRFSKEESNYTSPSS